MAKFGKQNSGLKKPKISPFEVYSARDVFGQHGFRIVRKNRMTFDIFKLNAPSVETQQRLNDSISSYGKNSMGNDNNARQMRMERYRKIANFPLGSKL